MRCRRLRLLDVDSDPELQRRYGLKIPVLLLDAVPVCSGGSTRTSCCARCATDLSAA